MRYGLLRETKPADPPVERGYTPELWCELDDLYRGGYQIAARAEEYLPKIVGESLERWRERCKLAAYIGYFGGITGVYAASLFAQPVAVLPASDAEDASTPGDLPDRATYDAFSRNADLRGTPFSQLMASVAPTVLVKGKTFIGVDFPRAPGGVEPASRADSDALGLDRPYAYEVLPEEVTNWEYDCVLRTRVEVGGGRGSVSFDVGSFRWVVLRSTKTERPDVNAARSVVIDEYKVWRRRDDGVVVWEVYRVAHDPKQPLQDDDDVPMVDGGATNFRAIPLVEIRVPETLWLGNVIGPLNKEHWQRRSGLLSAQQRALVVIPTVYLGPEIGEVGGAMPAEAGQDPSRGDDPRGRYERQGYLVLGKDDKLRFEGPPTEAFTIVDKQLNGLVDEIHRVSGRMAASVSSTATAQARSGESKKQDNRDFTTVLFALGAVFRDAARRVYQLISEARGDEAVWTVHGLDRFDEEDAAAALDELLNLSTLELPSKTAKTEAYTRAIFALLPGLAPATQSTIRDEVRASIQPEEGAPPPVVLDEDDGDDSEVDAGAPLDAPAAQPTKPPPAQARRARAAKPAATVAPALPKGKLLGKRPTLAA